MDLNELAERIVADDRMSGVPRYQHRYSETERRLASAVVRRNDVARDVVTDYGDRCDDLAGCDCSMARLARMVRG